MGREADKRDQLLFAHKPQVDNEGRGRGREIAWQEPLPAEDCPESTCPCLHCPPLWALTAYAHPYVCFWDCSRGGQEGPFLPAFRPHTS